MKSHDCADTRGKTYRILILLAFSVGGKRKKEESRRTLALAHFGKEREQEDKLVEFICHSLVFYFKVCPVYLYMIFLETFKNAQKYKK